MQEQYGYNQVKKIQQQLRNKSFVWKKSKSREEQKIQETKLH